MSAPSAVPNPAAQPELPWRWVIIALIFLGTVINYIDRLALPVMASTIKEELHLNNVQYATINSSFLFVYAASMFLWGAVFDRLGNRIGFSIAVVLWSIAEIGHAMARGMVSLCGMRGLLGLGEAGNWPGATRTIAEWFPARQRALAMGIANTGASLGPVFALLTIDPLRVAYGWRNVFIITGAAGFVWLALWLIFYPKTKPLGPNTPAAAAPAARIPWAVLLRRREVWGIILARFFGDPIWWLYIVWLPLYLQEARGFTMKEVAAFSWAPYASAALGALSGGWFSGFLLHRCGWTVNRARKTAILAATACLMAGFPTAFATSPYVALGWMCITCFGFQFWVSNVQTLPSDLFPVGAVGSIAGFAGTAAGLGAVIFTQSTGWIVDHFSYTPVLIAAAVLGPVATTVLFFLVGKVRAHNVS
jgi:MFS transporter, ACS family, hexuronate transporter